MGMQFFDGEVEIFFASATRVLDVAKEMSVRDKSGCLYIANRSGAMKLALSYGLVTNEKAERSLHFAKSKVDRLSAHPGTYLSWQTRNAATGGVVCPGAGAVRGAFHLFGFHGFSDEMLDEAAMLVLAMDVGQLASNAAERCAKLSRNQHFVPLRNQFQKSFGRDFSVDERRAAAVASGQASFGDFQQA